MYTFLYLFCIPFFICFVYLSLFALYTFLNFVLYTFLYLLCIPFLTLFYIPFFICFVYHSLLCFVYLSLFVLCTFLNFVLYTFLYLFCVPFFTLFWIPFFICFRGREGTRCRSPRSNVVLVDVVDVMVQSAVFLFFFPLLFSLTLSRWQVLWSFERLGKRKTSFADFHPFFCFYCERDGTRDTERERERQCKENKTDLLRIEREREEKKKNNFTLVLFVLLLDHRDTLAAVAEYPVKTTTTKTTTTFTNSILTSCSLVSFSKS